MDAVDPADGRTAAARLPLVARRARVIKIQAPGPLKQIAAGRGHVAKLRRSAGQDRIRQQRVFRSHRFVVCQIGIRHQRPDPQASAIGLVDGRQRQPGDIDQPGRPLDIVLHQVDQVGAAGDEPGGRIRPDLTDGLGDIGRAGIGEPVHSAASWWRAPSCPSTCSMAATMFT